MSLTNVGLSPVVLSGTNQAPSPPFGLAGLPTSPTILAPGDSDQMSVTYDPTTPGTFDSWLAVNADGGGIRIPVTAKAATS